jgi:hypothetical protein
MDIVSRAKNILLTPKTEWPVIAAEPTDVKALFIGYVLPLAAIPAIATFIGQSLIGTTVLGSAFRMPFSVGIEIAVFAYISAVVGTYLIGFIISKLAPQFGGSENLMGGLKVAAYSYTASWLGGIFGVLPSLAWVGMLCGLYGFYLIYLGLRPVMGTPEEKSVIYTIVTVVIAIVVVGVFSVIAGSIVAGAVVGAMMH